MALLKDRRVILGAGAALALAAGLGIAALIASGGGNDEEASPASQGGLVVQTGRDDDIKLDPTRPLRCFVGGLFVGEMTVSDCATRNGVATGALDVGMDTTGALAASKGPNVNITPLPPEPPAAAAAADPVQKPAATESTSAAAAVARPGGATCWRYAGATWTSLQDMSRDACVQALYDGECLGLGAAAYGRWGDRTLRLTAGRIEISADNRVFRTLTEQGPGCSVQ